MKLGRIFLSSLLEARVKAVSDTFFSEINKITNSDQFVISDLASIKKDIREKEASGNDSALLRGELPKDIKDLQIKVATEFVEKVFVLLGLPIPRDVEYYYNPTVSATKPKVEKGGDEERSKPRIISITDYVFVKSKDDAVGGYICLQTRFLRKSTIQVISSETYLQYSPDKDTKYILWTPKEGANYSPSMYTRGVRTVEKDKTLGSLNDLTAARSTAKDIVRRNKRDSEEDGKEKETLPRGGISGSPRKWVEKEVSPSLRKGMTVKSFRKQKPQVKQDLRSKIQNLEVFWDDEIASSQYSKPLNPRAPRGENIIKERAKGLMVDILGVAYDNEVIEDIDRSSIEIDIQKPDKDSDVIRINAKHKKDLKMSFDMDKDTYEVNPDTAFIEINGIEVLAPYY